MSPCSEGKRPQIVPRPRLPRSAQVITKRSDVPQPGTSSRSKPGYCHYSVEFPGTPFRAEYISRSSRSTTSRTSTSNQPRLQNKGALSAAGIAQPLPSNSSPTTATQIHNRYSSTPFVFHKLYDLSTSSSSRQPLTTAENVKELNISGGVFLNSPQAVVQVYGGVSRAVSFQGPLRIHSLGVPAEHQTINPEKIPHGCDNSLPVPVRFVSIIQLPLGSHLQCRTWGTSKMVTPRRSRHVSQHVSGAILYSGISCFSF